MPMSAYTNALLPMISYPQPTLPAAIAGASEFAAALNLRLVGLDMQINPPVAVGFGAYTMPIVGTTIDAEDAKTKANAEAIARDFLSQTQRHGVNAELRRLSCDAIDAPGAATEAARLFDLSIVPVAPQSRADRDIAEAIVFGSGRPCLVLPHHRSAGLALFDRPLIAWDASRAATRALADALPLLKRANEAFLIVVAPEQSPAMRSLPDVERWLADHGVRVSSVRVEGTGKTAAAAIADHASSINANLLVMGAFGHSRVRDFILGGVTQSMLAEPKLSILFSH